MNTFPTLSIDNFECLNLMRKLIDCRYVHRRMGTATEIIFLKSGILSVERAEDAQLEGI